MAAVAIGVAVTSAPSARAVPSSAAARVEAAAISTESGSDLAVRLRAYDWLLPRIQYDVAVTNNGPQALASAAVVVQLDHRLSTADAPQCTFDSATTTVVCPVTNLPAGATTTISFWAWFTNLGWSPATITATATRTSSTPPDPNGSNDTDSATCFWEQGPGLLPPFAMHC